MARVDLTHPDLRHLLTWVQDGVVARFQLLAYGATDSDIERMVRRRELTVAHPGVYVVHSGPLTYAQREWVAVLAVWPAALARESALPGHRPQTIQVAVERGRTLRAPPGVRVRRTSGLADRGRPGSRPPRVRVEHAIIDVLVAHLDRRDVAEAFASLARACFSKATTPDRILAVLGERARVPHRATIRGLLTDLRAGACSVLERGYLHDVERAHGLPCGVRQHPSDATGRRTYVDVSYEEFGLHVELDGRAFHDSPEAWDADSMRDLAEKAGGVETVRITFAMVFRTPCRTAALVAVVLRRLGWTGVLQACPRCPEALARSA